MLRVWRADNPSVALDELPPSAAAAMVQRWHPSLASDLVLAEAASAPDCTMFDAPLNAVHMMRLKSAATGEPSA